MLQAQQPLNVVLGLMKLALADEGQEVLPLPRLLPGDQLQEVLHVVGGLVQGPVLQGQQLIKAHSFC